MRDILTILACGDGKGGDLETVQKERLMLNALADRWWTFALRGAFALRPALCCLLFQDHLIERGQVRS